MSDPPVRCLRVGCANPRSSPDHRGLGLCDEHNHQLGAGTIGAGTDPTVREHPVAAAQDLIAQIRRPGESIRALARRTGLSKDLLWHITRGSFAHVRSEAWEGIQEAVAAIRFEDARQTAPSPTVTRPLTAETVPSGTGTQLQLFDLSDGL